jgi:hypothetical protein
MRVAKLLCLFDRDVPYGTSINRPPMHSDVRRDSEIGSRDPEDTDMHRAHRYISSLFLATALMAPVSIMAATPQDASVQVRIYDRDHHDYHNWDDREDRAYRSYLTEQHQAYRAYGKQHRKAQSQYWNWRHSHPDHD